MPTVAAAAALPSSVVDWRDHDTRVGAYAVLVDGQDRILLALLNESMRPAWTLPGGGVEADETPEQAAVREVREETGYDVELIRLLGEDVFNVSAEERLDGSKRALTSRRVVFEAQVVGGVLTDEVGGTTERAAWIPLAEVSGLERVGLVDVGLQLAQRCPKWWARGRHVTTSGVAATRRASGERLSSSLTRTLRFRSTRS